MTGTGLDETIARQGRRDGPAGFGAQPRSVAEAVATLDRISRHCVYTCEFGGSCVDSTCGAWRVQQAAADYLVANWVAAEG